MDPYGNAANQYGQEMMYGTRLQAGLDQQKGEFPNQLYDRFMQAYQQQIRQKQLDAEMARKQQHEDTYLKMAQRGEERDNDVAKAKFADWISNNYKEGRDDGMAILLGKTAGLDPDSVKAMLPKGTYAKAPSAPDTQVEYNGETLNLPNPAMPSMEESYTPGRGQRVAYQEGEQARKEASDRALQDKNQKKLDIDRLLAKLKAKAVDSRGNVDNARILKLEADAANAKAELEAGMPGAKVSNIWNMISNRNASTRIAQQNADTSRGSLDLRRTAFEYGDPMEETLTATRAAAQTAPIDPATGKPAVAEVAAGAKRLLAGKPKRVAPALNTAPSHSAPPTGGKRKQFADAQGNLVWFHIENGKWVKD